MNRPQHFLKIVWAILLSLAAHLLFWFGPQIHVPATQPQFKPLEAELVTLAPIPAAPKFQPPPESSRIKKLPELPGSIARSDISDAPQAPPPEVNSPVTNDIATSSEAAQESGQPHAEEKKPPFPLPEQAEIQYLLYKGINGLNVGTVVQTWKMQNNHYSLTSIAQATGIFSLIKSGKLVQTSQGSLTENGLVPDAFWIQRGQSADSTEFARFDQNDKTLTFGSNQNSQTVTLPDGSQDLLSFIYQIAAAPPQSGKFQLFITNGRKLDTYEYQVIGEELLDMPIGQIRSLHLSRVHAPNEDGTDIWLGLDLHNLPVKIRFTDREGGVAEQIASAIQIK